MCGVQGMLVIFLLGEESLGVIAAALMEHPASSPPTHIYRPSSLPVSCQMDLQLVEETLHSHLSSENSLGCPISQEFPSPLRLDTYLRPTPLSYPTLPLSHPKSLGETVLFLLLLQDS